MIFSIFVVEIKIFILNSNLNIVIYTDIIIFIPVIHPLKINLLSLFCCVYNYWERLSIKIEAYDIRSVNILVQVCLWGFSVRFPGLNTSHGWKRTSRELIPCVIFFPLAFLSSLLSTRFHRISSMGRDPKILITPLFPTN